MSTNRDRQKLEKRRARERNQKKRSRTPRSSVPPVGNVSRAQYMILRPPLLEVEENLLNLQRLWDEGPGRPFDEIRREFERPETQERLKHSASPRQRALRMVAEAWSGPDTEVEAKAQEALAVDPLCADALLVLALRQSDSHGLRGQRLEAAVEAARTSLGEAAFEDDQGHFWAAGLTRPYVRAVFALALHCWEVGAGERGLELLEGLLDLMEDDRPGCRYWLLGWYLTCQRTADAGALLRRFPADAGAPWKWARALERFQTGDHRGARQALKQARQRCISAESYLTGQRTLTEPVTMWSLGDPSEGRLVAEVLTLAFAATPGAREWLKFGEAHA